MATIICYDAYGNAVPVASEALTFRPAVYGIFIESNQVYLLKHSDTSLWYPPGIVLSELDTPTQAIRHRFRDLTGMTPTLGPMIYVEDLYHIDEDRRAWHLSALYYALLRPNMATAASPAETSQTEELVWVPLEDLARNEMQFGYEAVQAARLQLKL